MTKEETKEYNREYRERNKELLKIKAAEKYQETKEITKEKRKLAAKEYHSKNKKQRNQKNKENYLLKKEEYHTRTRKYRSLNKEKLNKRQRDNLTPEKRKVFKVKSKYGITIEEYNKMFNTQKGCCFICKIHQTNLKKKLFIDHNHETGKVRGLLCGHCNSAIGFAKENIDILNNIINYLNLHKS